MKVHFWGTRGSIPTPGKDTIIYGGNTTCLEITLNSGKKIIIDAGTGIRSLGDKLISLEDRVDILLLITHIHWDHVLGFPFFAPLYKSSTRIAIDGFTNCMKGLRTSFDNNLGDGFFPVKFDELKAEIQYLNIINHEPLRIDGVIIESIPIQHPQGGLGFRFREGGKSLVFLTDNELTNDVLAKRHPEDYFKFCKDADILIHDAQYTPEEKDVRKGWGHSDYASALDLAIKSHVKKLILYHHDPSRKDTEVLSITNRCRELARINKTDIEIDAAKEGSGLTL